MGLRSCFVFPFVLGLQSQWARWGRWQRPENPPAAVGHSRAGEVRHPQLPAARWRKGSNCVLPTWGPEPGAASQSVDLPLDKIHCQISRKGSRDSGSVFHSRSKGEKTILFWMDSYLGIFFPSFLDLYPFLCLFLLLNHKKVAVWHVWFLPGCWNLADSLVGMKSYGQRLLDQDSTTWTADKKLLSVSYSFCLLSQPPWTILLVF